MPDPQKSPASLFADTSISGLRILLFVAGVVLYLSFGYTEMMGSDLWWHLAAGRELFQTGTPWMVDDWSYSAHGHDWLNHEWFSDVIFHSWAAVFGMDALVYWKWLVVIATYLMLQWTLLRENGNPFAALLCAAIAVALGAPFIDVRPHLYSLLCYALLLCLLLGREPRRWVLALLFLVWVNLHGGFFFGLMALSVLVFPWRDFSLPRLRSAVLTCLICVAAASLNPSGLKTFLYPLIYAFDSSSPFRELGEWHSPFRPGGIRAPLFFYFMWAPALALFYLLPQVRRRTGVPWEGLVLTALTLAMALTSRRFIPIFGISLAVMLAPLAALVCNQLRHRAAAFGVAVLVLLFAAWRVLPYPVQAAPAFHYLTAEYSYPADTVSFMQANHFKGNVFALYNWGGYLHLRTDGELKVFIDGRADTLYSAETYLQYVGILNNRPGWMQAIEATGADFILWPSTQRNGQGMLQALVGSGKWRLLYQDAVSWLLVRSDRSLPPRLLPSPPSADRDLSAAMGYARRNDAAKSLEYAQKARQQEPWQKTACQLEINLLRHQQKSAEADAVLAECLASFPTRMLR
ncbi:hypothetical protein [Haliea sp. E17]|uniref:hypothetical protein n=1 Tax=Haliea sp. E17 TaxID=3401576 RepID=UPI003AAAA684